MKSKKVAKTPKAPTTPSVPATRRPAALSVDLLRAVVGGRNAAEEARK